MGAQSGSAHTIARDFDIEAFFETYSSFFPHLPRRRAGAAAEESYTADWKEISARLKAQQDFICQLCNLNLRSRKDLLHVHHRNGVKGDNSRGNLQVLCIACHRRQPHHGHLFVRHETMQLINRMRRDQGLLDGNADWDTVFRYADPGLLGLLEACRTGGGWAPEVGLDLKDASGSLIATLEIAWPRTKAGVAISAQDLDAATAEGWRVWTMIDALNNVGQFLPFARR